MSGFFPEGFATATPWAWDGTGQALWPVCTTCGVLVGRPELHTHDEAPNRAVVDERLQYAPDDVVAEIVRHERRRWRGLLDRLARND